MDRTTFADLIKPIASSIAGRPVDEDLAQTLNADFGPGSGVFEAIEKACHEAIADGWMCAEGGEGRRFGRIIEPGPETHDLSIDVVDITDFTGPHHRHPNGEICMVMPVDESAAFCGHERGWCVFPPGSEHRPSVSGGRALVLYMLPEGSIEWSG